MFLLIVNLNLEQKFKTNAMFHKFCSKVSLIFTINLFLEPRTIYFITFLLFQDGLPLPIIVLPTHYFNMQCSNSKHKFQYYASEYN